MHSATTLPCCRPCHAATDGAMDAAYAGHRGSAATLLLLMIFTNFTMGLLVPNIYMRLRLPWSAASLLLQDMLLVSGSGLLWSAVPCMDATWAAACRLARVNLVCLSLMQAAACEPGHLPASFAGSRYGGADLPPLPGPGHCTVSRPVASRRYMLAMRGACLCLQLWSTSSSNPSALPLYSILTLAVALLLAGSAPVTSPSPNAAPHYLRQCTTINAWTSLLGMALALLAIHRLEGRARRLAGGTACLCARETAGEFASKARPVHAPCPIPSLRREYAARMAAAQHQLPSRMAREGAQPSILPLSGWWAADVFLLSCCMWQGAALLAPWLAPD